MNPTIPQSVIDAAYERDPAAASAEFGAQFRNDINSYVSREAIAGATVPGRRELLPAPNLYYTAFADPSGGSADSMTLAIAHREGEVAVLDCVREVKPPFSPEVVTRDFAAVLKSYRIRKVVGDRYAGEWVREPFKAQGITYSPSEQAKSDLYRNVLPLINSGKIELLDLPKMTAQFIGLERRTSRAGRDSIDHGPGAHDDLANAVAGALLLAKGRRPMQISDQALRELGIDPLSIQTDLPSPGTDGYYRMFGHYGRRW